MVNWSIGHTVGTHWFQNTAGVLPSHAQENRDPLCEDEDQDQEEQLQGQFHQLDGDDDLQCFWIFRWTDHLLLYGDDHRQVRWCNINIG